MTRAGFAATKTVAWTDRHAARDLFDLAGLAPIGALDREAAALFHESVGRPLAAHDFTHVPDDWQASLRHQTGHLPPAAECLEIVQGSYADSLGWTSQGRS